MGEKFRVIHDLIRRDLGDVVPPTRAITQSRTSCGALVRRRSDARIQLSADLVVAAVPPRSVLTRCRLRAVGRFRDLKSSERLALEVTPMMGAVA